MESLLFFEYIVTDSELEALVLECNLIKEHRPKYNTMLMDDKAYPSQECQYNEKAWKKAGMESLLFFPVFPHQCAILTVEAYASVCLSSL